MIKSLTGRVVHRIGLHLLRDTSPDAIAALERNIPRLRLSSGVNRTTSRRRFSALDESVGVILSRRFDRADALRAEDWAASDCLTSAEWAQTLFESFPNATLVASDLTLCVIQLELPQGGSYILEANGEPLHYIRRPVAIRLNQPALAPLLLNSLAASVARSKYEALRKRFDIPGAWLESEKEETLHQPPYMLRKIRLIHPDAEALRRSCDRFMIRRHSTFESSPQLCDVIRTMNIFNFSYFPKERLLEGIHAVAASLRQDGLWVVGRTMREHPPEHNVSILVRQRSGFRLLQRFGAGSEIEELALAPFPVPREETSICVESQAS